MLTESFQLLLGIAAAAGMALLLAGLALGRARRRAVASRLSLILNADPAFGATLDRPGGETGQAVASRSEMFVRAEKTVLASGPGQGLQRRIASAGLEVTVSEYLLLHLVLGALGATVALAAGQRPSVVVAAGLAGLYLPWWYVEGRRGQRREKFTLQLADTVALLVSALRAGQSLPQAVERASRESPEPSGAELRRVALEMRMGLPLGGALQNLAARVGSRDVDLLVTALDVQREVGGDIVPLMESMAEMMRERHRIKSEVHVITAQQRMAAQVMFAMPLVIAGLLFLINPAYMGQMLSSDRLLCGLPVFLMPITVLLLLGLGYVFVRRAARVEV